MKSYVVANSTNVNTDKYTLVNGAETVELERRTVINKVKNNEITLINKQIKRLGRGGREVLVDTDIPYNGITSEQILFDIYLASVIKNNEYDEEILFLTLSKMKSLFTRSVNLNENKELFKHCSDILKRFFNYMGKTKVKLPMIKEDVGICFKDKKGLKETRVFTECKTIFDSYLSNYNVPNSEVKKWYDGEKNILLYRCFLTILDDAYNHNNVDDLNAAYSILNKFFKEVDFTFLGGYLYATYTRDLLEAIIIEVRDKNVGSFSFPEIRPDERESKVRESIAVTNKELVKYKENLKRISSTYEGLVQGYGKPILDLLANIGDYSFIENSDNVNKVDLSNIGLSDSLSSQNVDIEKRYVADLTDSIEKTCDLIKKFKQYIDTNTTIKKYDNLVKFFDYSQKIADATGVNIVNEGLKTTKVGIEIFNVVRREIKKSQSSCLGPYSASFIDKFETCKKYELEILKYLLDIRGYYCFMEEKKKLLSFRKSEKWYPVFSNKTLKPMAIMSCEDFNDFGSDMYSATTDEIRYGLEVTWLSSYYFYEVYIRKGSASEINKDYLFLKVIIDMFNKIHCKGKETDLIRLHEHVYPALYKRLVNVPFNWKLSYNPNIIPQDVLKEK